MGLAFTKMDGAGNDFVAMDRRGLPPWDAAQLALLARTLCHRQHGVGADGVLVLSDAPSPDVDFAMRYINADGTIGEMCGNGARCMAVYAHRVGAAQETMRFQTDAGVYRAAVSGEHATIDFPDIETLPEVRRTHGPLHRALAFQYLVVGVPHAVMEVEDLDLFDVLGVGRAARHDQAFAPRGTNANFISLEGENRIRLRTYERGVEAETLACGTGSVASACCVAWSRSAHGPQRFTVVPTGGAELQIAFDAQRDGFRNVTLGGPARAVFTGEFIPPRSLREIELP